EALPEIAACDVDMPDMAIGIYDWAVVVDQRERRSWLISHGRDPRTFLQWDALRARFESTPAREPGEPFRILSDVASSFTREAYAAAFRRVQEHIRAGDCYQVNLTQRFSARVAGDHWHAYLQLRE